MLPYLAKGTLQMGLNYGPTDGERILDYSGGPNIISRVLNATILGCVERKIQLE